MSPSWIMLIDRQTICCPETSFKSSLFTWNMFSSTSYPFDNILADNHCICNKKALHLSYFLIDKKRFLLSKLAFQVVCDCSSSPRRIHFLARFSMRQLTYKKGLHNTIVPRTKNKHTLVLSYLDDVTWRRSRFFQAKISTRSLRFLVNVCYGSGVSGALTMFGNWLRKDDRGPFWVSD